MTVNIKRLPSLDRMGRRSIPYRINLGKETFDRMLVNVPETQRAYYEDKAEVLGAPAVDVVLPEEVAVSISFDCPKKAVKDMYEISINNKLFATADILQNVVKALA